MDGGLDNIILCFIIHLHYNYLKVGQVSADGQKLQITELEEGHQYLVRVVAKNEVGRSDPLVSEKPILVERPPGEPRLHATYAHLIYWFIYIADYVEPKTEDKEKEKEKKEGEKEKDDTPSLSFSTSTSTSWLKESGLKATITSYTRHRLIQRNEYFFKLYWHIQPYTPSTEEEKAKRLEEVRAKRREQGLPEDMDSEQEIDSDDEVKFFYYDDDKDEQKE